MLTKKYFFSNPSKIFLSKFFCFTSFGSKFLLMLPKNLLQIILAAVSMGVALILGLFLGLFYTEIPFKNSLGL